jgi:DNA polymerase III gamma/tau subunit
MNYEDAGIKENADRVKDPLIFNIQGINMSLQREYRPNSFKTFMGNLAIIDGLKNVLGRKKSIPDVFLFTGSSGTGKTTLGRIVRRALKCKLADYTELNASSDRGIEGIRKIIDSMKYAPLSGKTKVYLLDEAHMITKTAQEALLKALEEPPPYVYFIICTTNPEALKPTFKRRCHLYELELLSDNEIAKLVKSVLKKEGVSKFNSKITDHIIEMADGSAGIALKLLDQVIDFTDSKKAISILKSSGTSESDVIDICRLLVNLEMMPNSKWNKLKVMLKNLKTDGESARRPILGYLSSVLINNGSITIAFMMEEFKNNFFDSGKAGLILACYKAVYSEE